MNIIYEEGPVLVINKPPGLLTQAPYGIPSLESQLREFLKSRDDKPGNIYLGTPHRLDRPASGAIIFARNVRATRRLAEQFEGRLIKKSYWAGTQNMVDSDAETWTDHVRKVPNIAQAEIVPATHPEGREAILHYRSLGRTDHGSWLEITLETGRMHQIRVQAASRGVPLLGDTQYGGTIPFGEQFPDERLRAIALHARRIEFRHPMTQEIVAVEAPLHPAWENLIHSVSTAEPT